MLNNASLALELLRTVALCEYGRCSRAALRGDPPVVIRVMVDELLRIWSGYSDELERYLNVYAEVRRDFPAALDSN